MSRYDIQLVRNSSARLVLTLTDKSTRLPLDVSDSNLAVRLRVRRAGAPAAAGDVDCSKLPGRVMPDGSINTEPPYDTPGAGGRVQAQVPGAFFDAAGEWHAEVRLQHLDTAELIIPHDLVRITVREDL